MKHINLTKPNKRGLAEFMVTQESNNFGDQILSLKKYETWIEGDNKVSAYKIIAVTSRHENDWMDLKKMKMWLKNVKKQLETK